MDRFRRLKEPEPDPDTVPPEPPPPPPPPVLSMLELFFFITQC